MKSKFPISQTSSLVPTKHEKKQIKSEMVSVVENYSKRRLLRDIAVTTPVVLAVSSKPALAMEDGCGSILMSGNLSTPQKILDCTPAEGTGGGSVSGFADTTSRFDSMISSKKTKKVNSGSPKYSRKTFTKK